LSRPPQNANLAKRNSLLKIVLVGVQGPAGVQITLSCTNPEVTIHGQPSTVVVGCASLTGGPRTKPFGI
jgi:hypothetical protein